jgi:5'-phosphate synthase pdxT subunit
MTTTIGVLALQGSFAEHIHMLKRLAVPTREVRTATDLAQVSALIIPGGESTTIGKLLRISELDGLIRQRAEDGMPVWGTCAGMVLLGRDIGDSGSKVGEPQPLLGLMDIRVRRNAFGSQLDSFETLLDAPDVADAPIPAVFIRAPVVEELGKDIKVLAALQDGRPVAVQQGSMLATAFHPELTDDTSFHQWFVNMSQTGVAEQQSEPSTSWESRACNVDHKA